MTFDTLELKMSDGIPVCLHRWLPDGECTAVVVLSHGMAEHAMRYQHLASTLCERGFALYAEDHRGHGDTAQKALDAGTGMFGHLGAKESFFRVVDDIHEDILLARKNHPGKKLILAGHSFGSFLAQCVMERYASDIDGCVLCGTAGPRNALIGAGSLVAAIVGLFGKTRVSPLLNAMVFGASNARIPHPRTNFDWLSRDPAQVDSYVCDPRCGFPCTTGFFQELFRGLLWIHAPKHMALIPKSLPVLIIAGTDDPVGSYAKTVRGLYKRYQKNGMTSVTLKLFDGGRHELFNETNRNEVEHTLLAWLEQACAETSGKQP